MLTRLVAGKPLTKENIAILADWKSGASARVVMRADALDARVNLQTIPGPMAAEEVSLPIEGRDLSPGFYRFHVSAPGRVPTIATAFLPPGARATIEIVLPKADATTAGMLSYGGSWLPRLNSHADATQKDNPVVRREQTAYLLDAKRVTVREYAAFLLERPANERRSLVPKNWPVGGAPRARMDDAVVGLTLDQADAYAKSKGKRVPVTGELVNAAMPGLIAPMLDSPANGAADLSDPEARRALLKSVGALIERLDGLAQWDGEPEWAHTTQGTGKPWPILGGEGRPKPPIAAAAGTHIHLRLAR